MNAVVSLAPDSAAKKSEVGDILKLQIFIDEKIGSPGDGWEVVAPPDSAWLPAGGVTVATMSVRVLPVDGNATKLEVEAMVHQPGPLTVGPLQLRNQVTKAEVDVPVAVITGSEAQAGTKPKEEPPWLLTSVRFGGWDWVMLGILLVILLAVGITAGRYFWRRLRGHIGRKFTNTEWALNDLANLQRYSRSKKTIELEEWKKFSFELARILRKYSDKNFHIDSSDLTDRELLQELRLHSSAAPYVNLLGTILDTITEVRYGRKALDLSIVPGLLLDARKFVETTSVDERHGRDQHNNARPEGRAP